MLTSPEQVSDLSFPVVLKAQVPTGGRGKAGGIKVAMDRAEAEALCRTSCWALTSGATPCVRILAEAMSEIQREIYVAVLFDKGSNQVMIVGSAEGGVDIEQVAKESPEQNCQKGPQSFPGPAPVCRTQRCQGAGHQGTKAVWGHS